ncbi:MAG: hypothetical protein BGP22_06045 [Variovorax sp. 67-131]|nr:MAG: hypothetical protein ABS94_16205 [Variovorax sp. SCN 67-85]ODV22302.1 MAG: hypothetical protein ABT25_21385 [Variovorax sp. SCN 67-20]OJZ14250.1 MAG: hypothetical protein BGP22_06045 [Variovorax sp. 67-131]
MRFGHRSTRTAIAAKPVVTLRRSSVIVFLQCGAAADVAHDVLRAIAEFTKTQQPAIEERHVVDLLPGPLVYRHSEGFLSNSGSGFLLALPLKVTHSLGDVRSEVVAPLVEFRRSLHGLVRQLGKILHSILDRDARHPVHLHDRGGRLLQDLALHLARGDQAAQGLGRFCTRSAGGACDLDFHSAELVVRYPGIVATRRPRPRIRSLFPHSVDSALAHIARRLHGEFDARFAPKDCQRQIRDLGSACEFPQRIRCSRYLFCHRRGICKNSSCLFSSHVCMVRLS